MLNIADIEKYKENNRLEAKAATVGLPKSLWATYSAFANTNGGIILLGVTEDAQHRLHVEGVNDAETLVINFWNIINNQSKVSVNILSDKHVTILEFDGKEVIAIDVPRAQRYDKPIYLDGNMFAAYKRNGDGDYRCTKEAIQAMLRDASSKTQDMLILGNMDLAVFDKESIKRYRRRMQGIRPGHVWESLEDEDFLYRIGAVGREADGKLHPTAAGLLMFGFEYEIVKEYPHYFLDYREKLDENLRWSDRFVSSSGDWSGNIYDFYFRVYNRLTQSLKIPFKLEGIDRIDDTPLHKALREALANTLINADYYGNVGVVVERSLNQITLTNAGTFRIDLNEAIGGGLSDPRNSALIKMFSLINIGERAGSGLPMIYKAWADSDYAMPDIIEQENPDRVCFTLPVECLDWNEPINGQNSSSEPINEPISDQNSSSEPINEPISDQNSSSEPINEPISDQNSSSEPINEPISDQNSSTIIADIKLKGDLCSLLLQTIIQMPYCTKNELAIKLNLSVAKIKRLITELQRAGKLKRIGSNKKGQWLVIKN